MLKILEIRLAVRLTGCSPLVRVGAAACLTGLLLVWPGRSATSQEVLTEMPPNAVAGASVFGAKGCIKCHSISALRTAMGLESESPPEAWSFFRLAAAMWNHMPVMASSMDELGIRRPYLDPDEIADLVVFVFNRSRQASPGDTAAGHALFSEKRCIRCHQVRGVGGVTGPNLEFTNAFQSPMRLAAAMWNHGPEMAESMATQDIRRGRLTGPELVDLYAYFSVPGEAGQSVAGPVLPGSAGRGRGLYQSKGCRACHGAEGRGGRGPSLASRNRYWTSAEFAAAMWNKAPAMLSQMKASGLLAPRLTPIEMADIVAYLYSLRYFQGAGNPELGRETIRQKGCLDCHSLGAEGQGGELDLSQTPGLDSPQSVIAALWNHVALLEELPAQGRDSWPSIEDSEMANVVAFMLALP